jgi:hypothetical protein
LEVLASYLQKSSALWDQSAGRKGETLLRIVFQIIQPVCLFTEIDHQFMGLGPNSHQTRPNPVFSQEWVRAGFNTFHDHGFAR